MGRLLAFELSQSGWAVTLYDKDNKAGKDSCAFTAAGMLAPYCEYEPSMPIISELGIRSMRRWPEIIHQLKRDVLCEFNGSLVVAHGLDQGDLTQLEERVRKWNPSEEIMRAVSGDELDQTEPGIAPAFNRGLFFPKEGHVSNRDLLLAFEAALEGVVTWKTGEAIEFINPGDFSEDKIIDCRGLGAKKELPELRGVRGELIYVKAPEVSLQRPVRFMHPRFPLYVVPRQDHTFVIGASEIESEDMGPISVRSSLELLSAAYTLNPAFAEAQIISTHVNCRPAFPDNLPRIIVSDKLIRINGLYRHGFLLGPILSTMVQQLMSDNGPEAEFASFIQKVS